VSLCVARTASDSTKQGEPGYVADQLLEFKPTGNRRKKQLQTFLSLIGATLVEVINTNSMIATNAKQTLPVENCY
jgi:hypothetical protein